MATVLIVDDDEVIRELYQHIVSDAGHQVLSAKDAPEARAIITAHEDLDVAIVDRVLPGEEDGLDVLRCIQTNQPLCQTILVSGYPTFSSASEALRHSAFEYLTKPVTPVRLRAALDAAIEERGRRKEQILDAEQNRKGFEALKEKQELLQHDMRSLLVGIMGFANLLIKRTSLDQLQLEYCNQIVDCGTQLQNMLNTYLDISDLEREGFHLSKSHFNLLEVPQAAGKTLHFLAEKKDVDISIDFNARGLSAEDEIPFDGNQTYLQNAFNNLLKNAIEASPRGKRVKIRIKGSETELSMCIHNWGAIPEEVRTTFFERYATSGKQDGLGLGTYMANLVVRAHDGRMHFASSKEEGTEVGMILPYNQAMP
jgi:two-component system sensor histidine kinase/response regulator